MDHPERPAGGDIASDVNGRASRCSGADACDVRRQVSGPGGGSSAVFPAMNVLVVKPFVPCVKGAARLGPTLPPAWAAVVGVTAQQRPCARPRQW